MSFQPHLRTLGVAPHTEADDRHDAAMAQVLNYHYQRYSSLGYDDNFAMCSAMIRAHLCENMVRLGRFNNGLPIRGVDDTMVKILGIADGLLEHDNDLMEHFTRFLGMLELSSNRRDTTIDVGLERVVEKGKTLEMLLHVFKKLYRLRLFFISTFHSAQFAIELMKVNPTLEAITFGFVGKVTDPLPFKSKKSASTFVDAVIKHGGLKTLRINACELGRTKARISAFVPVLQHVTEVSFDGNDIGSCGGAVKLIANCLASNPYVQWLSLESNNLDDSDASKLAASLKTNSTLRVLVLSYNDFGQAGVISLLRAINGDGVNLNSVADSNHHCRIDACELDLFHLNEVGVRDNKASKLYYATQRNMNILSETPTKLVPNLLVLLQEGGRLYKHDKTLSPLNSLFQFFRELNGILVNVIFSSHDGPDICGDVEEVAESLGSVRMSSDD